MRKFITKKKSTRTILYAILLAFIVFDLSYSFKQYRGATLDGDIADCVLPGLCIQKLFDDPTGVKTIINNDKHLGTNRFFTHFFMYKTFREIPLFFQKFCDPINSVYYTSAVAKLAMQIMILLLLAIIVNGNFRLFAFKFILITAIILPFFQTNGNLLVREIGIIDPSITYSFSYALPLIFVLLYYLPLFLELLHNKKIKMNWFLIVLWAVFAIISCFSGPLNSPIILITNFILLGYLFIKNWSSGSKNFSRHAELVSASPAKGGIAGQAHNDGSILSKIFTSIKKIDSRMYWFLIPISVIALYSTFLGTYIDAYEDIKPSLKELYLLLPKGIFNSFINFISYSIILFLLVANYLIIRLKHKNNEQSKKIMNLYKFLLVFSIIYLLLLPFGGYRPYRPLLLRYDTILPITIFSIITICYAIQFILQQLQPEKWKNVLKITYCLVIFLILLFFTYKDQIYIYNECEKSSLYMISNSKEDIIVLENDCSVVGWFPVYTPEESKYYGELLYLWKITDKPKLYYNRPQNE